MSTRAVVFGRRRTERASARLTTRTRQLRAEITQLEVELPTVASWAEQAESELGTSLLE